MLRITFALILSFMSMASHAQSVGSARSSPRDMILRGCPFPIDTSIDKENYEHVFKKLEIPPQFPRYQGMTWADFIQTHFDFIELEKQLGYPVYYSDSVLVTFVVTREGVLCSLSFQGDHSLFLRQAIFKMFAQSPNWMPGYSGSRQLDSWRTLSIAVVMNFPKQYYRIVSSKDDYKYDEHHFAWLEPKDTCNQKVLRPALVN